MAKTDINKDFVVITETLIKSYGVKVIAAGGSCEQFNRNPVMLYMHERGNVIGTWVNLRLEGTQWLATPNFDLVDEYAKGISGKVERGILKAASATINPTEWHYEGEGKSRIVVFDNWEFKEISIVDLPACEDALRLVSNDNKIIELGVGLKLSEQFPDLNLDKQMEFKELIKRLGLPDTTTEQQIEASFRDGMNAVAELKKVNDEREVAQSFKAGVMIDIAIKNGDLKAEEKQEYLDAAKRDFSFFEKTMVKINSKQAEVHVSLNERIRGAAMQGVAGDIKELSFTEMMRQNPEGLLKLQQTNKTAWAALYKKEFGSEPEQ